MNVPSARLGFKDIIRVEGLEIRKSEADRLALLGPTVTVTIVKAGAVARKQRLEVPERLVGVVRCLTATCVTNHERTPSVFDRVGVAPLELRCVYCERRATPPFTFIAG